MDIREYKDNLIIESQAEAEEIIKGRALDIILQLKVRELSEDELISRLDIYPIKLKLYLSRLESIGVIEKSKQKIYKNQLKTTYRLKSENLSVILDNCSGANLTYQMLNNINMYSEFINNGFKNVMNNPNKVCKHAAVFIRSNEDKMKKFKERLNDFINEFINEDEEEGEECYLLMPVLLPYDLAENRGDKEDRNIEESI